MLLSSLSLPNLHEPGRTHVSPGNQCTAAVSSVLPDTCIFARKSSVLTQLKFDAVVQALEQEPPGALSGSALELLSLALVNTASWPAKTALAWKHDADTSPYSAFFAGKQKCWSDMQSLPGDRVDQCIEVTHDGNNNYSASIQGKTWRAWGDDSFFKLLLAIRDDVSSELISDHQAGALRKELTHNLIEQRSLLEGMWQEGEQSPARLGFVSPATAVNNGARTMTSVPVSVQCNPLWVNPETRPACKYSPVKVLELPLNGARVKNRAEVLQSMHAVLHNRVEVCRSLAMDRGVPSSGSWFSFIRPPRIEAPWLSKSTVPALVISGGSASKLDAELRKNYSLAWHPKNMTGVLGSRSEPVYLLVHKLDYPAYASTMKDVFEQYPNLHLVGWDGGKLTGFGAARASALAFADTLAYRPERIMLIDQDVVKTEQTRHTNPAVRNQIDAIHTATRQPIVGYGIGYPERQAPPKPFMETSPPQAQDFNSPAQQFVSIKAPFRGQWTDGIYPPYMVAGGEDMLMGKELGLNIAGRNVVLPEERIVKKALGGVADTPNAYWSEGRTQTLKALFESEKNTVIQFEEQTMTLDELMYLFQGRGWIASHPSDDSYNVSACVIERIILRLQNELAKER